MNRKGVKTCDSQDVAVLAGAVSNVLLVGVAVEQKSVEQRWEDPYGSGSGCDLQETLSQGSDGVRVRAMSTMQD